VMYKVLRSAPPNAAERADLALSGVR
jgi:hypothetical protein